MTTRNGNFATLPLPHQYANAGNTIRTEYGKLKNAVYSALKNPNSVKVDFCKLLPNLFQLRMKILAEESFSFQEYVELNELMYGKMMRLKDGRGLDHLLEAIRFSMRIYDRVMRSLADNHSEPMPEHENAKKAPFPNYDVFLVTLSYLPQGDTLINWVHSSMFLELGFIAIDNLMQDGTPLPPNESLEELASLVSESGHNFGASARQLGILPKKGSGNPIRWPEHISNEDLQEEHALSELGLSEFAKNLQ
jgi:hypothetical protein